MKKNNKGFSLVELIVIIAIMAVLAIPIVTYVGMLGNSQAKKCAKELANHISQTKVCAMSRSYASMTVYADDTGVYVKTVQGETEKTEKIGDKSVTVKFRDIRGSSTYTTVGNTEATGLKLEFDRASGACKKMASGKYCYGFEIICGSSKYTIELEPLTGKASVR